MGMRGTGVSKEDSGSASDAQGHTRIQCTMGTGWDQGSGKGVFRTVYKMGTHCTASRRFNIRQLSEMQI
jgi:ribonuclease PH